MATRDATTGSSYEAVIEMCIKRSCAKNALSAVRQADVGIKPGGGRHRIDWEIIDTINEDNRGLISCKFQGTSGTTEEKLAYEVIKLLHAMKLDPRYKKSWIIMGGEGWSENMREFMNFHLVKWIPEMKNRVFILTTDQLLSTEIELSV